MPNFFIDRPIFAWVIALIILLAGVLTIPQLPIAQYPNIAAPSVALTIAYPGASAEVIERSAVTLIEQQMNGVENLLYMESTSEFGTATVTITFKTGTNVDLAAVDVQNRLKSVEARLPSVVQRLGVTLTKPRRNYLMFVSLHSPDNSYSSVDLNSFASARVLDDLRRLPGVGDVLLFGSEYAMRIWLKQDKLRSFKLSPADITNALSAQNVQLATGSVGQLPASDQQSLSAIITTRGTLTSAEEFANVPVRTSSDGSIIRIGDVARVELGAESYTSQFRRLGQSGAGMAIRVSPTGNALSVSNAVKEKMAELAKSFPSGVAWDVPYDSSTFIKISMQEVLKTLLEAIVLVFLVIFIFLGNIRASLVPAVVVPLCLLGSLTVLYFLGFSINLLTLFAMVLAIGLVVDDAIVVVENVERIMEEEHLEAHAATRKAMSQIVGAIIGITLVLMAVFVPMMFYGGSVGVIYRQFSATLIVTLLFSSFFALSLSPAMCAAYLRPTVHGKANKGFLGRALAWFHDVFARFTAWYADKMGHFLKFIPRGLVVYVAVILGTAFFALRIPSGFVPAEDQGYFFNIIQLPPTATQNQTLEVVKKIEDFYKQQPEIEKYISVLGFSFFGSGQNNALMFARLKSWNDRQGADHSAAAIVQRANMTFFRLKEAIFFAINPPPIAELSALGGFDFRLKDVGGNGWQKLLEVRNQVLGMAGQHPALAEVRPQGQEPAPQLRLDIDTDKAQILGLDVASLNDSLQTALGSGYVNDFVRQGRILKVMVQADKDLRLNPQSILGLFVRTKDNKMVELGSIAKTHWVVSPPRLEHFNGVLATQIGGNPAPGKSSGEALQAMEDIASKLPPGFSYEWGTTSFEEKSAGSNVGLLYFLSIVAVFLTLSALYESWSIPLAVILVIPLGVLGTALLTWLRGFENDVYFKVGLITIIGLACKNAILIVEFARSLHEKGEDIMTAAIDAAKLRFRPIIMTSLAFICGVLPLAVSSGAGAASRQAIGTGVLGGMITATILAVLLVPLFFVIVSRTFPPKKRHE